MIKIDKGNAPSILIKKEESWKNELLKAIDEYGCYSKIPNKKRNAILKNYKHKDIKDTLLSVTHSKCVFCEGRPSECGDDEIDHFKPKSVYPEFTFNWDNLFITCRICNRNKRDHDVVKNKIINPAKDNPDCYFWYDEIRINSIEQKGVSIVAQTTINLLKLNHSRLLNARGELFKALK